jgi:hypothetical protein
MKNFPVSIEAILALLDDVLIDALADLESDRADKIKKEIISALDRARMAGAKLGLVSGMTSRNVVVACEAIFGKKFIDRFDVVVSKDQVFMEWLSLPGIETALTILRVPAHRTVALICNDTDAADAYEAGINQRWYLDDPDENASTL